VSGEKWTLIMNNGKPCGISNESNKRFCDLSGCKLKDARLMQFAPDLLELLEQALEYDRHPDYDFDSYFVNQCRSVIDRITN